MGAALNGFVFLPDVAPHQDNLGHTGGAFSQVWRGPEKPIMDLNCNDLSDAICGAGATTGGQWTRTPNSFSSTASRKVVRENVLLQQQDSGATHAFGGELTPSDTP